jgi:hypothetical protein
MESQIKAIHFNQGEEGMRLNRVSGKSVFIKCVITLILFVFITSCSQQQAEVAGNSKDLQPIKKAGYYEDPALGFSIAWPTEVFNQQGVTNEQMVVNVNNAAGSPTLIVFVDPDGGKYTMENAAELYLQSIKQMYPQTTRHKIYSQKQIQICGLDAVYGEMKWKWSGNIPLLTVFTTTLKDGKAITVSATSIPAKPPVQVLESWAKSIQFK